MITKKALIALIIMGASLGSCTLINEYLSLSNDHIFEEFIERVIESEMGLEIDLTPGSPE